MLKPFSIPYSYLGLSDFGRAKLESKIFSSLQYDMHFPYFDPFYKNFIWIYQIQSVCREIVGCFVAQVISMNLRFTNVYSCPSFVHLHGWASNVNNQYINGSWMSNKVSSAGSAHSIAVWLSFTFLSKKPSVPIVIKDPFSMGRRRTCYWCLKNINMSFYIHIYPQGRKFSYGVQ